MTGWWTSIDGYVFNDSNGNGKMDPGERACPISRSGLKKRENSLMDRGAVTVMTDAIGYYFMENAYPMTQWLVEEAYSDLYYTTGVTYQADNQPTETTVLGAGVDVSVLPIIGLWRPAGLGRAAPLLRRRHANGGIVGTVSYDTTRNELDPRYAAVGELAARHLGPDRESLRARDCGTNTGAPCDAIRALRAGRRRLLRQGSAAEYVPDRDLGAAHERLRGPGRRTATRSSRG